MIKYLLLALTLSGCGATRGDPNDNFMTRAFNNLAEAQAQKAPTTHCVVHKSLIKSWDDDIDCN